MREVVQAGSPASKSHLLQPEADQQSQSVLQESPFLPQHSPVGHLPNQSRTTSIPANAAILNRAASGHASSNHQHLLQLQRQYGNQYVNQVVQRSRLQAKLTVGAVNDPYEQEADRVAQQVVSQISSTNQPPVQAMGMEEEEMTQTKLLIQRQMPEDEEMMQPKPAIQRLTTDEATDAAPDIEAAIEQARGNGHPLSESIRVPMEQAFGADFAGVRVHADARSNQLNQSIQARAFTTGQDIFFRQGDYDPGSRSGQKLIAHELTHVVQQNGGAVQRDSLALFPVPWATSKGASLNLHHPRVQRKLTKPNDGGVWKPAGSKKKWDALTALQRTKIVRMANDEYRYYEFKTIDQIFDFVNGVPGNEPKVTSYKSKQSQVPGSNPNDKFQDLYDQLARGGLNPDFEVPKHTSNWANFLDANYRAVKTQLGGNYKDPLKSELDKLYAEALGYADILDKQEVEESETLDLSDKNNIWPGVGLEQNINKIWKLVAKELAKNRQSLPTAIVPRWGQLQPGGMGLKVEIVFTPDNMATMASGSTANRDQFHPPWAEILDERREGSKTYYVEGHLLNALLGGSAAAYNLVPLTNSANATHEKNVEKYVKNKVRDMLKERNPTYSPIQNPIVSITYKVTAQYNPTKREHSKGWREVLVLIREINKELDDNHKTYDSTQRTVFAFRNNLLKGNYRLNKTASGIHITDDKIWPRLQPVVNQINPDRTQYTMATLFKIVDRIDDLWTYEDEKVPKQIDCVFETKRKDGSKDADGNFNEPVRNELEKMPFNQTWKMIRPL